jgi:hypothetical protein
MIVGEDNDLWNHHDLKPGDLCPYCGTRLTLRRERSFWTLFRTKLWVRCSKEACDFAVPLTGTKAAVSVASTNENGDPSLLCRSRSWLHR